VLPPSRSSQNVIRPQFDGLVELALRRFQLAARGVRPAQVVVQRGVGFGGLLGG
jgi:hypothetical protein